MSTNVTWNGVTYAIPAPGETGWGTQVTNFLLALGNNAGITQEMKQAVRVATTTPVTVVAATDCVVLSNLAAPGAVAVTLPAGVDGQWFLIGDQAGDAATNNVTITPNGAETINGAATYVINDNRGGVVLVYSTTNTRWNVVARFTAGTVLINPMDSAGDMIYGGASGVATKLDSGTANDLLVSGGAATPAWASTIAGSKTWTGPHAITAGGVTATTRAGSTPLFRTTGTSTPNFIFWGLNNSDFDGILGAFSAEGSTFIGGYFYHSSNADELRYSGSNNFPSFIRFNSAGGIKFYADTAGTLNNVYTPTERLSLDSTGVLRSTATGSLSVVRADTQNGNGSTNTIVRRWTNSTTTGTDITYADSATLGGTFTINVSGLYAIDYGDASSVAGANFGATVNSTTLTGNVVSVAYPQLMFIMSSALNDVFACGSTVRHFAAGDVIRAQTDGAANTGSPGRAHFTIQRII